MAVMASVRRTQEPMIVSNGVSLNVVAVAIVLGALAIGGVVAALMWHLAPLVAAAILGMLLAPAPKIAQQWERAIVLRFGRFIGLQTLEVGGALHVGGGGLQGHVEAAPFFGDSHHISYELGEDSVRVAHRTGKALAPDDIFLDLFKSDRHLRVTYTLADGLERLGRAV